MKMKRIKGEKEVLAALATGFDWPPNHVEVITSDGTVKGIRFGKVRISLDNYNFIIEQEVDFDTERRHRVVAKAKGFGEQVKYFEDVYEARKHRDSFGSDADVELVESIECMVNSAGEVIGEVGPADKPIDHNGFDVPF